MKSNESKSETSIIPIESVTQRIFLIRGQKVMLDVDLAELFEITTKALNQAIKRNTSRFPEDFMFKLTMTETEILNRSQFVTGSQKHRDPRFPPYAFTEHGVAMLASVLKSSRAIQMNILVVRAFIRIREILASNKELAGKIEDLEREQRLQNRHINAIYSMVNKLIEKPVEKPAEKTEEIRKPIGFSRN